MKLITGAETITLDAGANKDPVFINWSYGGRKLTIEDVKTMVIRLKASAKMNLGFFWTNPTEGNFIISKSHSVSLEPTNDFVTVAVNLSDVARWNASSGEVTRVRYDMEDFGTNQTLEIDWIRWYGDFEEELTYEEMVERQDSMEVIDGNYTWNFDINNSRDGWKFNKFIADTVVENGKLSYGVVSRGAEMSTIGELDIDAKSIKSIKVRLKNSVPGGTAKLRFITDTDSEYSDSKEFAIELRQNNMLPYEYTVRTENAEGWNGKIKGLKFVPMDNIGDVEIDYITLSAE